MIVGVPRETFPDERRVALVPHVVPTLTGAGLAVLVKAGAGAAAGFADEAYEQRGAKLADSREEVFAEADVVLQVRMLGANPEAGRTDLDLIRKGQVLIGFADPLAHPQVVAEAAKRGAVVLALELLPRITRAQLMDALSSMATVAGYKAVLMVDAAIVMGANDVVNPVARTDPNSPIAGMPILDVDKARLVVIIKRTLGPGFAGIPNPLFAADNTLMYFGDGRKAVLDLIAAIQAM